VEELSKGPWRETTANMEKYSCDLRQLELSCEDTAAAEDRQWRHQPMAPCIVDVRLD